VIAAALLAAAGAAACERTPTSTPPAPAPGTARPETTGDLPDEATFLRQVDRTRGTKDSFLPLRDPEFVPADAAPGMADDEIVLCLDLPRNADGADGRAPPNATGSPAAAVCYPTRYLNFHEIVEHRMAGLELLACW
jgi:hypothetical protein